MTVADLTTLFDYSYWANVRIFRAVECLSAEAFSRPLNGGHGSIRDTLVHTLSAERGWLARCGGPERGPSLRGEDFVSVAALTAAWGETETQVRRFLASLTDGDLERMAKYANNRGEARSMPLGELLHHTAIHAVHHRGQVATMLRLLEQPAEPIDILFYFAGQRGVTAW